MTEASLKICILGNSHVASFKTGWQAIREFYPNIEITFYPFNGPSHARQFFTSFTPEHDSLTISNPNLKARFIQLSRSDGYVRPNEFDQMLVVGGFHWWHGIDRTAYSTQVIQAALRTHVSKANIWPFLKNLRKISDIPVALTHVPFVASREVSIARAQAGYQDEVKLVNASVLASMKAQMISQPEVTFGPYLQTHLKYAIGEYYLQKGSADEPKQVLVDDRWHMNSAFGAKFLVKYLRSLSVKANNLDLPVPMGHVPINAQGKNVFQVY